jgi:hypothetical protein
VKPSKSQTGSEPACSETGASKPGKVKVVTDAPAVQKDPGEKHVTRSTGLLKNKTCWEVFETGDPLSDRPKKPVSAAETLRNLPLSDSAVSQSQSVEPPLTNLLDTAVESLQAAVPPSTVAGISTPVMPPGTETGAGPSVQDLVNVLTGIQADQSKMVQLRDLPTFGGQSHESAEEFLLKYERCGTVHSWTDADKLKYLNLACEKSALRWHEANKSRFTTWNIFREEFIKAFGKNLFDLDLLGLSRHFAASENPLGYVFEVLDYVLLCNPQATELERVQRLFDGLPMHLKGAFVREPPTTTQAFIERLKDVSREQRYNEKALISANACTPGILSSITSFAEAATGRTNPAARPSYRSSATVSQQAATSTLPHSNAGNLNERFSSMEKQLEEITEIVRSSSLAADS